jgi:CubicO group peptidase (beta-lactamase class C family)
MRELNSEKLARNIESRIGGDISAGRVGGALVSVVQHDKVVYESAFGSFTPGGNDELPMNTIFRIASMTKPVTAAAVLIEASRGRLGLGDLVSDYLDGYRNLSIGKTEDGKIIITGQQKTLIRIYHLLTHTSGIGSGDIGDLRCMMTGEQKSSMKGSVSFHSTAPLGFDPFTAQAYATAAFDVAAAIIEKTSDMPFDEYLNKELFEPLGMTDTTFSPNEDQFKRLIGLHDLKDGESVCVPTLPGYVFADYPTSYTAAGAGLASTLEDYKHFAAMLLQGGQGIIKPEYVEMMSSPQVPQLIMPGSQRWGLGVRVICDSSYLRLPAGSFGWSGAYGTHFWVDPADDLYAVYMKNSLYDGGSGAITAANFEEDVERGF